jgi:hypothetical protein
MNVPRLYETLRFVDELERRLGLQQKLEAIKSSLDNLVQAPAHPPHQSTLASALNAFADAASKLGEETSPAHSALIAEIGGGEFFDPSMAESVKRVIASNAMTPSVARDSVQKLAKDRATFLADLAATHQGIRKLGVQGDPLAPGSAVMAFLIPRDLFKNHLGTFAKELSFVNQLILHFGEAVTGEVQPVELNDISSSVPTISIAAAVAVMMAIGAVVNKFLDAWKKVEEIREIRGRLSKIGMRRKATIDELTAEITSTVNDVVDESTEMLLSASPVDDGRKNELRVAIKRDTFRLFGQIERGLAVEIRVEPYGPKAQADANSKTALEDLRVLSRSLQFPQIVGEPVLLTSGDLEEPLDGTEAGASTTTKPAAAKKLKPKKSDDGQIPIKSET